MSPDVTRLAECDATAADGERCAALYAPYVRDTAVTFETTPPDAAEMAQRIDDATRRHAWLLLESEDGHLVGYAYGGPFAPRPAYQWACEVSVYLEQGRRRTGGGRALYEALLPRLASRGFRTALGGMTLPNDASAGLHRAMGFETAGLSIGPWAGSTAPGTTCSGCSAASGRATTRRPRRGDP